ncbi:MAG: helix-turn-helix transcriptional regulator [Culicoidibacterales bacterium]
MEKKLNDVTCFLTLLAFFSNNHSFSLSKVSEETQIPQRTVQRYIKKFRDAGLPIKSGSGHGGGFTISSSTKLPRFISADELVALLFAFQTLDQLYKLPFDDLHVPKILQQFLQTLPMDERKRFEDWKRVMHFSVSTRNLAAPDLSQLRDAALTQTKLKIQYVSASGANERTITPLGIYMLDGVWYCPAYCFSRQQERLFRADRIEIIEKLSIDELTHHSLAEWLSHYNTDYGDVQLTANLTPKGEVLAQAITWMDGKVSNGKLSVFVQSAKKKNLIEDLLSFGPELTLTAPESFITEIRTQLLATLQHYQ